MSNYMNKHIRDICLGDVKTPKEQILDILQKKT